MTYIIADKYCPEALTGCWLWLGYVEPRSGYGRAGYEGKRYMAHRLVYEIERGPIPDGLTLDHLCRNRACVNPDHLEPVTRGENVLRGDGVTARAARQTHCVSGHVLAGENLYTDARGRRACRQCRHARSVAHTKEKYARDPEFRAQAIARVRASELRRKHTPEYKAMRREIQRRYREKRLCRST